MTGALGMTLRARPSTIRRLGSITQSAKRRLVEIQRPALEQLHHIGAGPELRRPDSRRWPRPGYRSAARTPPAAGSANSRAAAWSDEPLAADHVGRHRPGRAAKADQGLVRSQGGPHPANRLEHWARGDPPQSFGVSRSIPSTSSGSSSGPSPVSKRTFCPSASGMTRMSENRIAASRSKRRSGCSVTSVASSGV